METALAGVASSRGYQHRIWFSRWQQQ